jgi:hypothetical protein
VSDFVHEVKTRLAEDKATKLNLSPFADECPACGRNIYEEETKLRRVNEGKDHDRPLYKCPCGTTFKKYEANGGR